MAKQLPISSTATDSANHQATGTEFSKKEMEIQLTNLVTALENATLMAKQLPISSTATDSANIYAALHDAHRHLSLFLSHTPQPSADVIDAADDDDASMQFADEEQQQVVDGATEVEDSKMTTIETVEERMKDCSLHNNKRLKRSLSPSSLAAVDQRRWLECEIESARAQVDYDPHLTKLRAIDLIYQFHC